MGLPALSAGLHVDFGSCLSFVPKTFPNVLPGVVVRRKGSFSYQVLFSYEGSDFSFHFLPGHKETEGWLW